MRVFGGLVTCREHISCFVARGSGGVRGGTSRTNQLSGASLERAKSRVNQSSCRNLEALAMIGGSGPGNVWCAKGRLLGRGNRWSKISLKQAGSCGPVSTVVGVDELGAGGAAAGQSLAACRGKELGTQVGGK